MSGVGFEIGCHNCIGACCRAGTLLQLTRAEADFLAQAGTQFEEIVSPDGVAEVLTYQGSDPTEIARRSIARELPPDKGAFGALTDCGHLAVDAATGRGICTVRDHPERPQACAELQEDSIPCNEMRRHLGIWSRLPAQPSRHS